MYRNLLLLIPLLVFAPIAWTADLPSTPAIKEALTKARAAMDKRDLAATRAAYMEVLALAEPTPENRLAMAKAVEKRFGFDAEKSYPTLGDAANALRELTMVYWVAVAERYPEPAIEARLAEEKAYWSGGALQKLIRSLEQEKPSSPLTDKHRQFQLAVPAVDEKLKELAASYDLQTLTPPTPAKPPEGGEGYSKEAWEKLDAVYAIPVVRDQTLGKEHSLFWKRLEAVQAIIETNPRYGFLYLTKAKTLAPAGFEKEAILTLTKGMRYLADTQMYELRADLWLKQGYPAQALADARTALERRTDRDNLLLFCRTALLSDVELPQSWREKVLPDALIELEGKYEGDFGRDADLHLALVKFWDAQGQTPRAKQAAARFRQRAPIDYKRAYSNHIQPLEKKWAEAAELALFYGLPKAPDPHSTAFICAYEAGDLVAAWQAFETWHQREPQAVEPILYGAAIFSDLEAPYLALATLSKASEASPTAEAATLIQRVKAVAHSQVGELVAAAKAQALAEDNPFNYYWLTAFIEANKVDAFRRIHERALTTLADEASEPQHAAWAWELYQAAAPEHAVDARRQELADAGNLPEPPAANAEPPLDLRIVRGEMTADTWWRWMQQAHEAGRADDAAFGAACWLLSIDSPDAADEEQALAIIRTYRDGETDDLAERLRRNPTDTAAMVAAYEAAHQRDDVFAAAQYLRHLWRAYGETDINLGAAREIALEAGDWDLLLAISANCLASENNAINREWYELALAVLDHPASINESPAASNLRAWRKLAKPYWGSTSKHAFSGAYAELGELLNTTSAYLYYKESERQSDWVTRRKKETMAEYEQARQQAPVLYLPHLRFLVGELDAESYRASLSHPDQVALGRLLVILRQWKMTKAKPTLTDGQLVELNQVFYSRTSPLPFRLVAYHMLREAETLPAPWPVRASDGLVMEKDRAGVRNELRAGRLGYASGTGAVHDLADGPPVLRLQMAPQLPLQVLVGLSSQQTEAKVAQFAKESLSPVVDRYLADLAAALDAAGTNEQRWVSYTRAGNQLDDLVKEAGLDKLTFSDRIFDTIKPYLNRHPEDAFVALMEIKSIDTRRGKDLSPQARQAAKTSARAAIDSYQRSKRSGNVSWDSIQSSVQRAMAEYPPGTTMHAFVLKQLEQGTPVEQLPEFVEKEKHRREAAAKAQAVEIKQQTQQLELKTAFYDALRRGQMQKAADLAYTLRGEPFVRWALRDPSVRLDELIMAKGYTDNWVDQQALDKEIAARTPKPQPAQRASRNPLGNTVGGSSWNDFKAEMEAKRQSSWDKQRQRDIKNGIFRDKARYGHY